MAIQAYSNFIHDVRRFVIRPYEEAERQLRYAFFWEKDNANSGVAPSLAGRVAPCLIGLVLVSLLPIVNAVAYVAMRYFEWDSGLRFCQAMQSGDLKQLDFFLQIGWNPNQYFRGKPLIFFAYESRQLETLERVLKSPKCHPNLFAGKQTLLHDAAEAGDTEVCRILLKSRADATVKRRGDKYTPAYLAYLKGHKELSLEITEEGNCVSDLVDQKGNALLNHAWDRKDFPMVLELLRRGASPPKKELPEYEVLKYVYGHSKDLIPRMIQSGWNVNAEDQEGNCLLSLSAKKRDWAFARKMVEYGAYFVRPDKSRLIAFSDHQSDREFYRDFLEDESLYPMMLSPYNLLRGETYLKWVMPSLVARCRREKLNPLEKVFFMGSDVALQHLARHLTYSEFLHHLVALRHKCDKRIYTDWVINALYELSPRHYREFEYQVDQSELIDHPEQHVFLNTIPDAFKKLGTLSEKERTFEGVTYTQEDLLQLLNNFVKAIIHKSEVAGLPKDKSERNQLYKKMEVFLRQIAYYLLQEGPSDEMKKKALLDLAYSGHCARDWHVVLYQVYCFLADENYQILTFADRVMIELGEFRLKLLKTMYKGNRDRYNFALAHLAYARKIPTEPPDPEDVPELDLNPLDEEIAFDQAYRPHMMVGAILGKRKEDQYFREYMIDYFRDNESSRWIEAPFDHLARDISRVKSPESLTPIEVQQFFAERGLPGVPLNLDGRPTTLQSALSHQRFMACYANIESEVDPKETLPLGIAKMLESMGHLRARDPYMFSRSFSKTFYERWVAPYI